MYIVTTVGQDSDAEHCPLERRLHYIFISLFGADNVTLDSTRGHFIIFNTSVQLYIEEVKSSGTPKEGITCCVTLKWDDKVTGLNRVVDCVLLVLLSVDCRADNGPKNGTEITKSSEAEIITDANRADVAPDLFRAQFGSAFKYDVGTDTAVIELDGGKNAKIRVQSMEIMECNSPPLRGRIDNLFASLLRLES